jgi:hypothetical protein
MRIESQLPRVPGSCGGGPAAPETFARVREAVRAQRPDRVTITGSAPGGGPPPAPILAEPAAASGEPTDPELAGPGSPRGPLVARYAAASGAPAPRLEVYG